MHFKEKFIQRVRIQKVLNIDISANDLVKKLLKLSETETVCFLDSCGVDHLASHLIIAGIKPLEALEFTNADAEKTLLQINQKVSNELASIFTISYGFGLKLENIHQRIKEVKTFYEPDIFLSTFDCLIIHDYNSKETNIVGNPKKFDLITETLNNIDVSADKFNILTKTPSNISSNFTKAEYISKIKEIQEYIRQGETYQTNLTQQFRANLSEDITPQRIFWNLRKNHPAPFASFIKRKNDFVVSISPERFVRIESKEPRPSHGNTNYRSIQTSPIKGTRPRGKTELEDLKLKNDLLTSEKDRAENTMIVDLLRNDLGRICDFGTVKVEKLCDLKQHPTLFHLVSTVSGNLRNDLTFADIIKAIFPCGSITGCPKIRTMELIDQLETVDRGLSMGAIGYSGFDNTFDLNVAIRTMTIRNDQAIFNVGGGIVIDSIPTDEYDESLLKAKALFRAIGIDTN